MNRRSSFSSVLRVLASGMILVGVAVAGLAVYEEFQSTSYQVQIDRTASGPPQSQSTTAYGGLTASQRATFDRLLTGQAAPVGGVDLEFFANNVVQYRGERYAFEVFYDPTTLTPLVVAVGLMVAGAGAGLFSLTRLLRWGTIEPTSRPT